MAGRNDTKGRQERMSLRRDRKKAHVHEKIYETSIRLFKQEGYDNVTVERIASQADVAKGTFFNYFPSKLHVLLTYWSDLAEDLIQYGEALRSRSARSFFKGFFRRLESRVQADKLIFAVLLREIMLQPELRARNERLTSRGFTLYRKVLEASVVAGEIRNTTDFTTVSSLIEDAWIGTLRSWVFSRYAFRLRSTFEKKLDVIFDGLRPTQVPRGNTRSRATKQ